MSWIRGAESGSARRASGAKARPASLAARLTAWYAGSAFAIVLLATALLYWTLSTHLRREDDFFLSDQAQVVVALAREHPGDQSAILQEVVWEPPAREHERTYIRVLDEQGRLIAETAKMDGALPASLFPPARAWTTGVVDSVEMRVRDGRTFLLATVLMGSGGSGASPWILQVASDRTPELGLLTDYRRTLYAVLGVAMILSVVTGHTIARRGMRPLQEIARAARHMRSTTLHQRIDLSRSPAELADLGATFNEMLDRLGESFTRLNRFSADIAHELRTPVGNLRGEIEVTLGRARSPEEYREVLASCLEECDRLSRVIDALLFLARSENAESPIHRQRLDVGETLTSVGDLYHAAAADAGITISVAAPDGVEAHLDKTLLQRAVDNLVANALAHTPRGGRVRMTVERDNGDVRVLVDDTGCGITAYDLPHVFDRFYRADRSRSARSGGTGLGLAIVKSIMTLHGGRADISSRVGAGTTVTLTFPSA